MVTPQTNFTGLKFLGASVVNISSNLGWGNSTGSISVTLAEDPSDGESFTKPEPGTAVYLEAGALSFGGIVQTWTENHNTQGNTFSVTVNDPRELLSNAQIILDQYEGSTLGIPNLINAYGSYPWGQAGVNEDGMPYNNIASVLADTTLEFTGQEFKLDLSAVAQAPVNFRISGPVTSVLDIIGEYCDQGALDWFVRLERTWNKSISKFEHIIKIHTTSLSSQSNRVLTKMQTFIDDNEDIVSDWSIGQELRNDTTAVMLIGGEVQDLYQADVMQPFWGYDKDNRPIVGTGEFELDISHLSIQGISPIYKCSPNEIRAVLGGPKSWGQYLSLFKPTTFGGLGFVETRVENLQRIVETFDPGIASGTPLWDAKGYIDDFRQHGIYNWFIRENAQGKGVKDEDGEWIYDRVVVYEGGGGFFNPDGTEQKLDAAHIAEWTDAQIYRAAVDFVTGFGEQNATGHRAFVTNRKMAHRLNAWNRRVKIAHQRLEANARDELEGLPTDPDEHREKLFNYLHNIGQEYYGKQFFVPIPPMQEYFDSGSEEFKYSLEVVDSAWREDTVFGSEPLGISNENAHKFKVQDGKFTSFVRYDSVTQVDLGQLDPADYVVEGNLIFLKCEVDTNIVRVGPIVPTLDDIDLQPNFTNSKAVVIKLPGNVPSLVSGIEYPPQIGMMNFLHTWLTHLNIRPSAEGFRQRLMKPTEASELIENLLADTLPADMTNFNAASSQLIPNLVTIPLVNHVNSYGPWSAHQTGSAGKVELITDSNLVPWNFGGTQFLDIAGNDKVVRAAAGLKNIETGRVTVAGLPELNIGEELLSSGPIITDISIAQGTDGVRTTYSMSTYTPKFGDFGKNRSNQLQKIGKLSTGSMNNLRVASRAAGGEGVAKSSSNIGYSKKGYAFGRPEETADFIEPHDILWGKAGSNTVFQTNAKQALETANPETERLYKRIGGSSQNSIFRICSTDPDDELFPSYVTPDENAAFPTVADLNPFPSGHDMLVVSGRNVDVNSSYVADFHEGSARPASLRAPLILTGWGYDTDGKPVPNASPQYPDDPSEEFFDGHLFRTEKWKSGPLDAKWDEARGVWVTGDSGAKMYVVIAQSGNMSGRPGTGIAGGRVHPKPLYVCRPISNIAEEGQIQYEDPLSSGTEAFYDDTDKIAFNIQEGPGDIHTIGLGSPVMISTQFNQYFFDLLPRTFIRRRDIL